MTDSLKGDDEFGDPLWSVYRSTQDGDIRIDIEDRWFTNEQAAEFAEAIRTVVRYG